MSSPARRNKNRVAPLPLPPGAEASSPGALSLSRSSSASLSRSSSASVLLGSVGKSSSRKSAWGTAAAPRSPPPLPIDVPSVEDLFADSDDEAAPEKANRMRYQLVQAQQALGAANAKIEQMALQILTLQGRESVRRVASEEASVKGKTWSIGNVKRFTLVAKGQPDFASDSLREMLDQAIVGVGRRLGEAIAEGGKARDEAKRADAEGDASLEDAFAKCKDAAVEHAARKAASAVLIRHQRVSAKLRAALRRLEEEASAAQAVHVTDMRSLSARLIAQRDAHTATVLDELQAAETEGSLSIRGLHEELRQTRQTLHHKVNGLEATHESLAQTAAALKDEKRGRDADVARLSTQVAALQQEAAEREAALATARAERDTGVGCLRAEVRSLEAAREADAERHRQALSTLRRERDARYSAYEAKLRGVRSEAQAMHGQLSTQIKGLAKEKEATERALSERVLQLQADKEKERAFLEQMSLP